MAFAPNGTWLVSGGEDMTVRIWDAESRSQRAELTGHIARVWAKWI